jgi:hypothetical protein
LGFFISAVIIEGEIERGTGGDNELKGNCKFTKMAYE